MRSSLFNPSHNRHSVRIACIGMALLAPLVTSSVADAAPFTAAAKTTANKTTNPLPVMNVTDVKTGKPFPLASALDGKKPLLVWFWAPT